VLIVMGTSFLEVAVAGIAAAVVVGIDVLPQLLLLLQSSDGVATNLVAVN